MMAALVMLVTGCGAPTPTPTTVDPGVTPSTPPSAAPSDRSSHPSASTVATTEPVTLAWERLDVAGPSPREDHTWTVAGSSGIAYLFGGRSGTTVFADTWAFDLEDRTWSELSPAGSPAPRFGHEAAWVEGVGVVIFAGQGGPTTFFNDLWVYDPTADAWRQLPASGAVPTPRYGSCVAIGPDGRLWMSHGFTQEGTRFSDTRAYDFVTETWSDVTPAEGRRPVERCLHGCWWTDEGALALYAGQTTGLTALDDLWVLEGDAWRRVETELPPGRNLYARTRLDAATLIVGGQAVDGTYLADLWLMADDETVARLEPAGEAPAARAGAELALDPVSGRAFVFGGRTADAALDDTWMLVGL